MAHNNQLYTPAAEVQKRVKCVASIWANWMSLPFFTFTQHECECDKLIVVLVNTNYEDRAHETLPSRWNIYYFIKSKRRLVHHLFGVEVTTNYTENWIIHHFVCRAYQGIVGLAMVKVFQVYDHGKWNNKPRYNFIGHGFHFTSSTFCKFNANIKVIKNNTWKGNRNTLPVHLTIFHPSLRHSVEFLIFYCSLENRKYAVAIRYRKSMEKQGKQSKTIIVKL